VSFFTCFQVYKANATEFSDYTFLVADANSGNLNNPRFWEIFTTNNYSGIRVGAQMLKGKIVLTETQQDFSWLLDQIQKITEGDESKIFPVFLDYQGEISVLDSVINSAAISSKIFFLPMGETWPSIDYLIQAKRNIIFFINSETGHESRVLHHLDHYVLRVSAADISGNTGYWQSSGTNLELFMLEAFDQLPIKTASSLRGLNMIPDYINFLLEKWTKFGKRPNFLMVDGDNLSGFSFIISQLNSFTWINGIIKISGKTSEKVYWKSPDVTVTGGKFSFPYRGGEEIILSPFVPGYRLTPQHIVVTGEMEIPESYVILASPVNLSEGITGNFHFEGAISNALDPEMVFHGENFSFTQDIERGGVLKLPENASINLGNPDHFRIRNSSFTVSCFAKFSEILEFGDNAIIGNHESEYRRGLHLILRSGHPYFGLWSNDYVSEEKLRPNTWYHIVWRYVIETGEQAIFLNGKNIGSSNGHPPFSGKGDIFLGSALSSGASLRGYIDDLNFWNRPLGNEEINRLALNEEIVLAAKTTIKSEIKLSATKIIIALMLLIGVFAIIYLVINRIRAKARKPLVVVPTSQSGNQIHLFGKFRVIDNQGNDISEMFTPKVKELLLYILISTLKNGAGAPVAEINENLWPGIPSGKVANNRAVTLNKLRKSLMQIDGIEIKAQNGLIAANIGEPLFCDFIEAYRLCTIKGDMTEQQLKTFFLIVKNGRFLKESNWAWLDEIRGLIGNQVIDNLLKLASVYKKEGNMEEMDAITRRILDYDELNEEAVYLQIWASQKVNNIYQAKFNYNLFLAKYLETMGEPYPMSFDQFNTHFAEII
jgi:two-component SAPR family response regulator